jgi:hypothetical protein
MDFAGAKGEVNALERANAGKALADPAGGEKFG